MIRILFSFITFGPCEPGICRLAPNHSYRCLLKRPRLWLLHKVSSWSMHLFRPNSRDKNLILEDRKSYNLSALRQDALKICKTNHPSIRLMNFLRWLTPTSPPPVYPWQSYLLFPIIFGNVKSENNLFLNMKPVRSVPPGTIFLFTLALH